MLIIFEATEGSTNDYLTGTYDPIPKLPTDGEGKPFKEIKLDSMRARYWLGVGAQPSDATWRLLSMVIRTGKHKWAI